MFTSNMIVLLVVVGLVSGTAVTRLGDTETLEQHDLLEFHKFNLKDEPFGCKDWNTNLKPLDELEQNSAFIFHGISGTGKTSMIETLCNVPGIAGIGEERTKETKRYPLLFSDGKSVSPRSVVSAEIIDTPGFGESENYLNRTYLGMDAVVDFHRENRLLGGGIRQIYFFIPHQGRNFEECVVNNIKAMQEVYGKECVKYLTLVQSASDGLKYNNKEEVKSLRMGLLARLENVFGLKFKILFTASKTAGPDDACIIQLTEHMLLSSRSFNNKPAFQFSGTLYREKLAEYKRRKNDLEETLKMLTMKENVLVQREKGVKIIKIGLKIVLILGTAAIVAASTMASGGTGTAAAVAAGGEVIREGSKVFRSFSKDDLKSDFKGFDKAPNAEFNEMEQEFQGLGEFSSLDEKVEPKPSDIEGFTKIGETSSEALKSKSQPKYAIYLKDGVKETEKCLKMVHEIFSGNLKDVNQQIVRARKWEKLLDDQFEGYLSLVKVNS